jgi:hypothetical protein
VTLRPQGLPQVRRPAHSARMVFLAAGVYGIALSLMIFSSIWTPFLIDLFVTQPYTLGTHGADWEYWHGVGCAFVGMVSLMARKWPDAQKVGIASAIGFIYGVWGVQNLRLVLFTDRFGPLMWAHVVLCLAVGIWGVVTAMQLRKSA